MVKVISKPELFGLALCGGKSARMKTPKAEIDYHGMPQWQHALALLSRHCAKAFLSVSPYWRPADMHVPQIPDRFEQSFGPLTGILSAMRTHPSVAWLVIGVDMPFMDDDAIRALIHNRDADRLVSAFCHVDKMVEPLCAIYEPSVLSTLLEFWAAGTHCPRSILRTIGAHLIVAHNDRWLQNVNHIEEREEAKLSCSAKKTVQITYFAQLREQRGCSSEILETAMRSLRELYSELQTKHEFSLKPEHMRVAVSDRFVDWNTQMQSGDHIVFVPPVAGG